MTCILYHILYTLYIIYHIFYFISNILDDSVLFFIHYILYILDFVYYIHDFMFIWYVYNFLYHFSKALFFGRKWWNTMGWTRRIFLRKKSVKTVCQSWIPPSFFIINFLLDAKLWGEQFFWLKNYPTFWEIFFWRGDAETTWKTFGPSNGSEVGKASPTHVAVVSWRIVKGEPIKNIDWCSFLKVIFVKISVIPFTKHHLDGILLLWRLLGDVWWFWPRTSREKRFFYGGHKGIRRDRRVKETNVKTFGTEILVGIGACVCLWKTGLVRKQWWKSQINEWNYGKNRSNMLNIWIVHVYNRIYTYIHIYIYTHLLLWLVISHHNHILI